MKSLPIVDEEQRHGTGIQWVHLPGYKGVTWNVGKGCRRISPGCGRSGEFKGGCYAERLAIRMSGPGGAYEGLVRSTPNGPRWTGKVRFDVETLQQPLRWRKPHAVFVDSMSDLFYEEFTNEQIAAVFGVMAACPQHVFIILTKRAERMRKWFEWIERENDGIGGQPRALRCGVAANHCADVDYLGLPARWPLPTVWLGVSVESRAYLSRIDDLRRTPAAVRTVSLEPLLEDLGDGLDLRGIDQAIVGGESGPGAAPFDIAWARRIRDVSRRDRCAFFLKQVGAHPMSHDPADWQDDTSREDGFDRMRLRDRKGGDLSELPADLRVREWPMVRA